MEILHKTNQAILLIDDDEDDYELVNEAIRKINPSISVVYVNSCEQLIQYRHHNFGFVLLDINMPSHDGFYFLKAIRENGYKDIPIVMYSNSRSPVHIARSYQEGANLFFPKPDDFSGLLNGLRKLVNINWHTAARDNLTKLNDGIYPIFNTD